MTSSNTLGSLEEASNMASKMLLVKPIATTIMDKTVGRYQSMHGDPKMIHEFLQMCGEEVQSLLVNLYESAVAAERTRISSVLESQRFTSGRGRAPIMVGSEGERLTTSGRPGSRGSVGVGGRSVPSLSPEGRNVFSKASTSPNHRAPLLPAECYVSPHGPEGWRSEEVTPEQQAHARALKEQELDSRVDAMIAEGEERRKERSQQKSILQKVVRSTSYASIVPPLRLQAEGSTTNVQTTATPTVSIPFVSVAGDSEGSISRSPSMSLSHGAGGTGIHLAHGSSQSMSQVGPPASQFQEERFHQLVNRIDSLQVELDVSKSDQNFLRSITSEVIRDLENKEVTIAGLRGALERRDIVINEQRRAYIQELMHVREMLRQYKEKGRCDLADATLYSWDTNAVQRFQDEEMRAKIDAAVLEAKKTAQLEKDAMEAAFKRQTDDLKRRLALAGDNTSNGGRFATSISRSPGGVNASPLDASGRTDRELFELGATITSPQNHPDGLVEEEHLGDAFEALLTGRPQLKESDSSSLNALEVSPNSDKMPFSSVQNGKESIGVCSSPSSTFSEEDKHGTIRQSETGAPVKKSVRSRMGSVVLTEHDTTQGLPALVGEGLEADFPLPNDSSNKAPDNRSKNSPSVAGKELASTFQKSTLINVAKKMSGEKDAGEVSEKDSGFAEAVLENKIAVLEDRIKQRDAMIERLKLLVDGAVSSTDLSVKVKDKTSGPTVTSLESGITSPTIGALSAIEAELAVLLEKESLIRRREAIQDKLMVATPLSPNKSVGVSESDAKNVRRPPSAPVRSASKLSQRQLSDGVRAGLTAGSGTGGGAGAAALSALHQRIFSLQKQLASMTVGYEELCIKSKRWYDVYKEHKAHTSLAGERVEAERRLLNAVTLAEHAEDRYRVFSWKLVRQSQAYHNCLEGQRLDQKEAASTASYRTQQQLDTQMDILERALTHKLMRLRHQHQDVRAEANEAWDLVLIHAKAVSRALLAEDEETQSGMSAKEFERPTYSSLIKTADMKEEKARMAVGDITERQLELHNESAAQRRHFSAVAQQRLIEKYAVANVVKRYLALNASTQPYSVLHSEVTITKGSSPPRPPSVMRPVSGLSDGIPHLPNVSSRPTSAVVGRPPLHSAHSLSEVPESTVSLPYTSNADAQPPQTNGGGILDPRVLMMQQAEEERIERVRQASRRRALKGLGVVERLTQKRLEAAELVDTNSADVVAAPVLAGVGAGTEVVRPLKGTNPESMKDKPSGGDGLGVADQRLRPSSASVPFDSVKGQRFKGPIRPSSAASVASSTISMGNKGQRSDSFLLTAPLRPLQGSEAPRPYSSASVRDVSVASTAPSLLDVSAFKDVRPEKKRAILMDLMQKDQRARAEEKRDMVKSLYESRGHALVASGGAGSLAGATNTRVETPSHVVPPTHSYVHSKGRNTGAPSAEPFVFSTIGTFTTEQEVLAGVHRTKLFGKDGVGRM